YLFKWLTVFFINGTYLTLFPLPSSLIFGLPSLRSREFRRRFNISQSLAAVSYIVIMKHISRRPILVVSSGWRKRAAIAFSLKNTTGSLLSFATAIPDASRDNTVTSGLDILAYFRNDRIANNLWFLVDADTFLS